MNRFEKERSNHSNLVWLTPQSNHVAAFMRTRGDKNLYALFNFSDQKVFISWYLFKEHGLAPKRLLDHWSEQRFVVGPDHEFMVLEPYTFSLMEAY